MNKGCKGISIIIPVYQAEPYLEDCLNSVLVQTFEDYEILLINDGSTDGSAEICKRYSRIDPRIRLLEQENRGLSAARNLGLDHMAGEYVTMLDADDVFLDRDYLTILIDAINETKATISFCGHSSFQDNGQFPAPEKAFDGIKLMTGRDFFDGSFTPWETHMPYSSWGKLYHRECFAAVRYPEGKLHEDVYVAHEVLFPQKTIAVIGNRMYGYRIREGSITHGANDASLYRDRNEAMDERYRYFMEKGELKAAEFTQKYRNMRNRQFLDKLAKKRWGATIGEIVESENYAEELEYTISEEKKVAYLVNSKVACSSIKACFLDDGADHMHVHREAGKAGAIRTSLKDCHEYYCFTFVRNPFTRLVSCYESKYHRDAEIYGRNEFAEYLNGYIAEDEGFSVFVKKVCAIPYKKMDKHFRSQYNMIYDDQGNSRCDFVGRFENLEEEFKPIREKYGLRPLPHLNRTDVRDWMSHYTKETAELVHKTFKRDFEAFGYEESYKELMAYLDEHEQ